LLQDDKLRVSAPSFGLSAPSFGLVIAFVGLCVVQLLNNCIFRCLQWSILKIIDKRFIYEHN